MIPLLPDCVAKYVEEQHTTDERACHEGMEEAVSPCHPLHEGLEVVDNEACTTRGRSSCQY